MTNLERLKLELSNKAYYNDIEYTVFLSENGLVAEGVYSKATNQTDLLESVLAILETLSNDVDIMRKIDSKDIINVDQAFKYLAERIQSIKVKIIEVEESKVENYSNIRPLFFN